MFSQKINMITIKLTADHMTANVAEGKQPAKLTQDISSTRDC